MNNMFKKACVFNQYLSGWFVTTIPSLPADFSEETTAWTNPAFLPIWSTCP